MSINGGNVVSSFLERRHCPVHSGLASAPRRLHMRSSTGRSKLLTVRAQDVKSARVEKDAREVVLSDGKRLSAEKESYLIGSGPEVDIKVDGENVAAIHAKLEFNSGRVFCTALAGDEDDILSDTHTWHEGSQLRHGVAYMVSPGAPISFGKEGNQPLVVEFEETGGASWVMENMLKMMGNQCSEEGKNEINRQLELE